jgi:hypothetical protein
MAVTKYLSPGQSGSRPGALPSNTELEQEDADASSAKCKACQTGRVGAACVLEHAEERRHQETSDSPCSAHDSGNDFDIEWEPLRRQLEYCSVAHAQHAHDYEKERNHNGDWR